MRVEKIFLQKFRSYKNNLFEFEDGVVVLVGPNACGKTNVLEAVYLLATGESFRASKIDEMVMWDEEVGHVGGKVSKNGDESELQIALTRGIVNGEKTQKRKYVVNGVSRRKGTFVGNLVVVTFLPSDLQLISGSPSRRRKYLDVVLSQVNKEYRRSLLSYEKALRRRNKMLDLIRDGEVQKSALLYWDHLLIKEGNVLTKKRQEFAAYINDDPTELRVVYDFSSISEKRLKQYEKEEVLAGYTLVGPHKDDFYIESTEGERSRDLSTYGSRGEQRMGVLWLKSREMEYINKIVGERPVLLLDDIFSELDDEHEKEVWNLLKNQQTLITTTDFDDKKYSDVQKIELGE
ncbi:DNA replication/repair protein RecF [Patescibacteria group bacterium]